MVVATWFAAIVVMPVSWSPCTQTGMPAASAMCATSYRIEWAVPLLHRRRKP